MLNQEILNYVIIRKIGEGGMGSVYLAQNKSIHQFVAIKMLHPQYSNNPLLRERFRNEAIMLSSLNHPNIVKFLNFVENEQGIFLIMEYVDGMTLEDFISKKSGLIVEDRAYPMFRQILDAFNYAHKHNIVHRDIKPSNILINREGNLKILDFGIAQILSEADKSGIKGGGTPSYMSPEQIHDLPLDARSDIYSLGVVFYQMLTGQVPYDTRALSAFDIKQKVLSEPLPPMREAYPYIPEEMQTVISRATEKRPDARYQNCNDLKKEIIRAHKTIQARDGGGKSGGSGKGSGPKTWIMVTAAVLAFLIAGGGILFFLHKTEDGKYYYSDYVEKHGVPEGIHELKNKELGELKEGAFRVEYLGGKIIRIAYVNSKDSIIGVTDSLLALVKYPDVRFKYDNNGKIKNKEFYNEKGELQFKVDYDEKGEKATLTPKGSHHPANGIYYGEPTITNYALEYDNKGRLTSMKFLDENGKPAVNNDSIAGITFSYLKNGQIEKVGFIDPSGKAKANGYNFAYAEYDYGDNNLFKKSKSLDKDGKAVSAVKDKPGKSDAKVKDKKQGKGKSSSKKNDKPAVKKKTAPAKIAPYNKPYWDDV